MSYRDLRLWTNLIMEYKKKVCTGTVDLKKKRLLLKQNNKKAKNILLGLGFFMFVLQLQNPSLK